MHLKLLVSVLSELQTHVASRTFQALRRLTIRLHLFTYLFGNQLCLQKQKNLTAGRQCSDSLRPLAHMPQPVKLFLEFSKPITIHNNATI